MQIFTQKNEKILRIHFSHRLPLLEEGGIALGDAGRVVDGEVGSEQRHRHAVVMTRLMAGDSLQTVALLIRQALRARGMQGDTQTLAGQGDGGV